MKTTEHLTTINPEFERCVRQTYLGMAHFAATGPAGAVCGGCLHWSGGAHSGSASCREFMRRMRLTTPKKAHRVPQNAPACNAFEVRS